MMLEFDDNGGYDSWLDRERDLNPREPDPEPAHGDPPTPFDDPRSDAPSSTRVELPTSSSYAQAPTNAGDINNGPADDPRDREDDEAPGSSTSSSGRTYTAEEADFLRRNPGDEARMAAALSNYTGDRDFDSQSGYYNDDGTLNAAGRAAAAARTAGTRLAPAGGTGSGNNGSPLFDDPASRLLETYALDQFARRLNPDPNSGTALFEQYARELIDTLRKPVYSPQDEAIIKTQATDAIEQERTATKQRWLEEMARRGIPPSSGIALEGLQRIENQFNTMRTQVDAQFAAAAIDRTRDQRLQVLDTAGRLSDAEEGRMREAGTYARVPYDLQNDSFQRNLSLVGAAGSPADLAGTALGLANFSQNGTQLNDQSAMARAQLALALAQAGGNYNLSSQQLAQQQALLQSGDRAAQTAALLQLLGYMFG